VPQGRGTFTTMTVEETSSRRDSRARTGPASSPTSSGCTTTFPVLTAAPCPEAGTLFGGEQQMLRSPRALMLRPRLMLLDEPSFGLRR